MILCINYMYLAPAIDGQGPGFGELSRLSSGATPAAERLPVLGEFLHAIVSPFRDVEFTLLAERQVVRVRQLSRLRSGLPPAANELAVL